MAMEGMSKDKVPPSRELLEKYAKNGTVRVAALLWHMDAGQLFAHTSVGQTAQQVWGGARQGLEGGRHPQGFTTTACASPARTPLISLQPSLCQTDSHFHTHSHTCPIPHAGDDHIH